MSPLAGLRRGVAACVCVTVATVGCAGGDGPGSSGSDSTGATSTTEALPTDGRYRQVGFIDAAEPAAMAVAADGTLFIGERRTGRVLSVDPSQDAQVPLTVATLDVATDGQQGLLGLAVVPAGPTGSGEDPVLAAITAPNDGVPRQEVVRITGDGDATPVWIGPDAADQAIGGHLSVLPSGRVLIGLGDFLRGQADSFGADEPYSKLLSLDPAGPPDQRPEVVSSGWNNPFAFTVADGGDVWLADNAPGDTPERVGRGDGDGPVIDLVGERAPSGLAMVGSDELAMCGVVSGLLELVPIRDGVAQQPSAVLAEPCQLGVLALPGGGLAVAVSDGVRILIR